MKRYIFVCLGLILVVVSFLAIYIVFGKTAVHDDLRTEPTVHNSPESAAAVGVKGKMNFSDSDFRVIYLSPKQVDGSGTGQKSAKALNPIPAAKNSIQTFPMPAKR